MSPYASDIDNRNRVYVGLWVISAIIAFILSYYIDAMIADSEIIIQFFVFLASLSPMAVCILFIDYLPQRLLLRLSGIANVSGHYEGVLKTSHDDFQEEHPVKIVITQTMKSIDVSMSTHDSESFNTSAFIGVLDGKIALTYTYRNLGAVEKFLTQHDGTCTLIFHDSSISGEYYTTHDRKNYGAITLSSVKPVNQTPL